MANKKVSQLVSKPSVLVTDLFPIADPTTGQLYKTTISDLGTAIGSGVSSVNGLVGAVVLDTDDIQELASPTNRWFTDTRARAALSASSPLAYNSGTGVFSLPQANGSTNGFLSSADWTTFNAKQAALSGTGFVKISGTTISYDNSTYLTTSAAASTYLALAGGTLTGALNGTSATFSGDVTLSASNPRLYLTDTDNNPDYFISNTDGTFTIYDVTNSTSRLTISTLNTILNTNLRVDGDVLIKQDSVLGGVSGYTAIASDSDGIFLKLGTASAHAYLVLSSLTSFRNFTFPDATGTIALTSNLSSYLPLTGGTLTGGLSGTTGSFSGNVSTSAQLRIEPSGNAILVIGSRSSGTPFEIYNTSNILRIYNGSIDALQIATGSGAVTLAGALSGTSATFSGDVTINNGLADGGQLVLASSGFSNWNIDNFSGSLRAYYGASVALSINSSLATTFTSDVIAGDGSGSVSMAINRGAAGNSNGLRFRTAGTNNWYIGSGATGANTNLEIYNHNTATTNLLLNYSTGAATFSSSVTASGYFGTSIGLSGSSANSFSPFRIDNTSQTAQYMTIGVMGATAFGISGWDNSTVIESVSTGNATGTRGLVLSAYSGPIILQTNDRGERMRITSGGNVGIGTTAPSGRLSVASSQSVNNQLINIIGTQSGFEQEWGFGFPASSRDLRIYDYTAGLERMRLTSGGDLFIGSTSTINSERLFVRQSSSANLTGIAVGYGTSANQFRSMSINSSNVMTFNNGTNEATLTAAGAWSNASDARLKKNIVDIKYGLNTILESQPRSFNRVDVDGDYIGFIAQELLDLIPEVVSGDLNSQYCVDYGSLVAISFKAIQELKAELDTLKNK